MSNSRGCCVGTCNSASNREQDKGVTFHKFPKSPTLQNKWTAQAHLDIRVSKTKGSFICSRHFRKVDFEPFKASRFALKKGAIPTIFSWGVTPLEDLEKIFPKSEGSTSVPEAIAERKDSNADDEDDQISTSSSEKISCLKTGQDTLEEEKGTDKKAMNSKSDSAQKEESNLNSELVDDSLNPNSKEEEKKLKLIPQEKEIDSNLESAVKIAEAQVIKDCTIDDVMDIINKDTDVQKPEDVKTADIPSQVAGEKSTAEQEILTCVQNAAEESDLVDKGSQSSDGELKIDETVRTKATRRRGGGRKPKKKPQPKAAKLVVKEVLIDAEENIIQDVPAKFQQEENICIVRDGESDEKPVLNIPGIESIHDDLGIGSISTFAINKKDGTVKETGVLNVSKKVLPSPSTSSPMLKALIEKTKSPMTKPKSKVSSPGTAKVHSQKMMQSNSLSDKGSFVPGARVEAKDFSEQWYPARVVEVDQDDMEILIHYDNWSQRYDEWISMSSPRLRLMQGSSPSMPNCPPSYLVGERCLARWSDNRRFPATVRKVLTNGKYEVLFDDGFAKTLKWVMMSKVRSQSSSSPEPSRMAADTLSPLPYGARGPSALPAAPEQLPPPPIHNHLFDPSRDHLGSKEERRDKKRKLNVKELFSVKKSKLVDEMGEVEIKKKRKYKMSKDQRIRTPKLKLEIKREVDCINAAIAKQQPLEPLLEIRPDSSDAELLKHEWSCRWENGQPVGVVTQSAAEAKDGDVSNRLERISVQVGDHRLPAGWTKHLTRRCVGHSAGKWDVVLVCPHNRRYRSRAEMRQRMTEPDAAGLQPYIDCLMDFSVHRKLARRLGWDNSEPQATPRRPKSSAAALAVITPAVITSKPLKVEIPKEEIILEKVTEQPPTDILQTTSPVPAVPAALPPQPPPLEDGYVYVGSLKVQIIENLLRCPKEGCFKNFRKDNLLQMHVKHYHPDMCQFLGDAPNVADLAYARTKVEQVPSPKHKSGDSVERPARTKEKKHNVSLISPKIVEQDADKVNTDRPETPVQLREPKVEPVTPKKTVLNNLDELEASPKLRNALLDFDGSKPEIGAEKMELQAVKLEDVKNKNITPKIEHDIKPDSPIPFLKVEKLDIKNNKLSKNSEGLFKSKSSGSKKSKDAARLKSVAKISGVEDGKTSRSQSPIVKIETMDLNAFDSQKAKEPVIPKLGLGSLLVSHREKKMKRKIHMDRQRIDKKKSKPRNDSWNVFTPEHDETRSSFGTPEHIQGHGSLVEQMDMGIKSDEPQTPSKDESNHSSTVTIETGERVKIVHMKREEIINCHCRFGEEDGLMIQCELCLCWQHAICHGIQREAEVPEKYVCLICQQPDRGRRSQRHLQSQEWLYEGRLPRGALPPQPGDARRAALLRKSHELSANLLQLATFMHSLRYKMEVAEKKDHPKLYLWAKPWEDNPVDEVKPEIYSKKQQNGVKREEAAQNEMMMIDENIVVPEATNDEITIDEIKLEMVEQDGNDVPKCDNEVELTSCDLGENSGSQDVKPVLADTQMDGESATTALLADLLSSPGGTPISLPITNSELETLAQSVRVSAPQPEAAIDPVECRLRLLQHVERMQHLLEARLDSIEAQIIELESQDPSLEDDETAKFYPRTKETIQMLLRDLGTMEEYGSVS